MKNKPYINTHPCKNVTEYQVTKSIKRHRFEEWSFRDKYLLNNLVISVLRDSGMCWNFSSRISFHVTVASALNPENSVLNEKYQGVKEFHMLARIGCNCKIMVFSPFITYYHSSKGNK